MTDNRYAVLDPKRQELVVEGSLGQLNDCFGLSNDPSEQDFIDHCKERGYWFYRRVET